MSKLSNEEWLDEVERVGRVLDDALRDEGVDVSIAQAALGAVAEVALSMSSNPHEATVSFVTCLTAGVLRRTKQTRATEADHVH